MGAIPITRVEIKTISGIKDGSSRNTVSVFGRDLVELATSILNRGNRMRVRVSGLSMSPFIRCDDRVTLTPIGEATLVIGDVVACVQPGTGSLIIHRVIEIRSEVYLVKGDNTLAPDGWVERNDILGFVERIERKGKRIRIGTGPERRLIAWITRRDYHTLFLLPVWRHLRLCFKNTAGQSKHGN